jgi:hypothetical protein
MYFIYEYTGQKSLWNVIYIYIYIYSILGITSSNNNEIVLKKIETI